MFTWTINQIVVQFRVANVILDHDLLVTEAKELVKFKFMQLRQVNQIDFS